MFSQTKFRDAGQVPPTKIAQQLLGRDPPHSGWVHPQKRSSGIPESPPNSEESAWAAPDSLNSEFCILFLWQGRQCTVKIKVKKNKIKFREIFRCYSAHSCVIFVRMVGLALCVPLTPISTPKGVFLDPVS